MICYTNKHHHPFWIDEEDWKFVSGKTWSRDLNGYIHTPIKRKKALLHRLLMDAPSGMEVDHIDGNPSNNQRSNLRLCTHRQNLYNQRKIKKGISKYKSVCWFSPTAKWRSDIVFNGVSYHIGYFDTEEDAAYAYNQQAIRFYGEYANLNILPDWYTPPDESIQKHSSKYRGVSRVGKSDRWIAQLNINKEHIVIGRFKSEEEAAIAYAKFIRDNNVRRSRLKEFWNDKEV